jgi:hypothetical protein
MNRIFMAILVCLSIISPITASFAQTCEDSGLSSEISGAESEAQEDIQEVDSEMDSSEHGA